MFVPGNVSWLSSSMMRYYIGLTRLPLLQCWNITALSEENTKMLYSHHGKKL